MRYRATFILFLAYLATAQLTFGAKHPSPPDLQLVAPSALPGQTQAPAQDLLLYTNHFTYAWLYLEQEQGARLIVLNVAEPSNIRMVADVATGLEKPFDLVPVPHKHYAIARFRDGSGQMLLNLSHPRAPKVVAAPAGLSVAARSNSSQEYPGVELRAVGGVTGQAQDLQVIEPGATPRLIATIANVTRRAFREETGTLFLLGDHGLTVVRSHSKELDWELSFVDDESQN
jgi:hypothetical protein